MAYRLMIGVDINTQLPPFETAVTRVDDLKVKSTLQELRVGDIWKDELEERNDKDFEKITSI